MRTRWVRPRQVHQNPRWQLPAIPPTREDELAKQLNYQQHQIDTLVGQVKNLVSAVKAKRASSRGAITGGPGIHPHNTWRGGSRGRGQPAQTHPQTTSQPRARNPQLNQGPGHTYRFWQYGEVGHYRHECPTLKEKGLFKQGNALTALRDWRDIPHLNNPL